VLGSLVIFLVLRLVPGDPASSIAGPTATDEEYHRIRAQLGLDEPWPQQYLDWMGGVLRGDLGTSLRSGTDIAELLRETLPPTLQLAIFATLVAMAIGIPWGLIAGARPHSGWDRLLSVFVVGTVGVPNPLLAILLLSVFAVHLGWFPVAGYTPLTEDPLDALRALVLPAVALGLGMAAILARHTRSAVRETMGQEYVRTARAKGLPERSVLIRHVLPNSAHPVITVLALQVGSLLSGVVLIETVFTRPGLGRTLVEAVEFRDYPVVQDVMLLLVVVFVLVNFVADISSDLLDPRAREG
jgi:peptide/nickel transport system permease protein